MLKGLYVKKRQDIKRNNIERLSYSTAETTRLETIIWSLRSDSEFQIAQVSNRPVETET